MKRFVLSLAMTACAMQAQVQGNHRALTVKQAELLAMNAPPTLDRIWRNCCPDARGYETQAGSLAAPYTLIGVQVRCSCGQGAAQLIDNYMVDPTTGKIWEGLEETGTPLHSKRLDALRKSMFTSK